MLMVRYLGSTVQSPTNINYSSFQSSSMGQNAQGRSRLRAASASLPLNLGAAYRPVGSGQSMQPTAHSPTARSPSGPQLGSGSSSYTASFPSAPLTAPMDFALPRTPGFRSTGQDYSMPQMSAPIAPPGDFHQAFQSMTGSSARTPIRDTFSGTTLGAGDRSDDYAKGSGSSSGGPTYANSN